MPGKQGRVTYQSAGIFQARGQVGTKETVYDCVSRTASHVIIMYFLEVALDCQMKDAVFQLPLLTKGWL